MGLGARAGLRLGARAEVPPFPALKLSLAPNLTHNPNLHRNLNRAFSSFVDVFCIGTASKRNIILPDHPTRPVAHIHFARALIRLIVARRLIVFRSGDRRLAII